jgi:hypothetical protein
MNREAALMDVRYAKYATIDNNGITQLFASLREIQSNYGVNFTTISKCIKEEGIGLCNINRDGDWLVVRSLCPPA